MTDLTSIDPTSTGPTSTGPTSTGPTSTGPASTDPTGTDPTSTDMTRTVDTYLAMWNEEDPSRRAEHIAAAWTDDGRYADPLQEAEGHAALSEMVAGIHQQLPGHRFTRTSGVDVHHGELRFGWQLAAPDGTVAVAGVDVGAIADDGRLRRITGFFGPLPEG